MKFKKPTKSQVFLGFCLGLFAIHRIYLRAPSEAEMIAKFHAHKVQFEEIRRMLRTDKNVATIGDRWVSAGYGPDKIQSKENKKLGITNLHELPLNVSEKRIELYRSRLKKLGFSRVDSQAGRVQMSEFGGGFTDTTWSIGYFYSEKLPIPLVESAYKQRPPRDKRHYSRIEGNWYLFHRR